MAGTLFVVCVPTKEHEDSILNQEASSGFKSSSSTNNLQKVPDSLGVRLSTRSKSEESLFAVDENGQDGSAHREMFIGPWRVDATDLPVITPAGRGPSRFNARSFCSPRSPGRNSRSPLVDTAHMSRSDPEGLSAKQARVTPTSTFKKRRHRYLEKELEKILENLEINNAVWCMGRNSRYYQVLFSIESGDPCETTLHKLAERGIGVLLNSVVSVLPCALYYQGSEKSGGGSMDNLRPDEAPKKEKECPGVSVAGGGVVRAKGTEQGTWERFVQSVRARLTVAQVVEGVRANAVFTFDFLLLLIVAAFVAALGLLEDSTVILVASMLISPLMGPVMAATFGTMINDRGLRRMGLINECVGLMLCLLIGFVSGLVVGFLDRPWPTAEMLDRGELRSLWVNVLIAVLSGAGIAIALLRDNTGSLVGVAISASLLPPAVNAGLLWAMALVCVVVSPVSLETQTNMSSNQEEALPHYSSHYSDSPPIEMALMGGISLCITLINIVFIYLTGILMLKVKEVAPNSQTHQRFWKHDVKIARDYNTTLYGASAAEILRSVVNKEKCGQGMDEGPEGNKPAQFTPELARLLQLSTGFSSHYGGGVGFEYTPHLSACPQHQLTWSPSTLRGPEHHVDDTVRELEGLYRTIRQRQQQQQRLQQHNRFNLPAGNRRASFGNTSVAKSYPSWRLGSSDGYRCSLSKQTPERARGDECRCPSRRSRRIVANADPRSAKSVSAVHDSDQVDVMLAVCTPPFNNMPVQRAKLVDLAGPTTSAFCMTPTTSATFITPTTSASFITPTTAVASSAFKTPHGRDSFYVDVPPTPEGFFLTPSASESGGPPTPASGKTVLSLDDETVKVIGQADPASQRPVKKRRFVVTKTDDSEMLLPPA